MSKFSAYAEKANNIAKSALDELAKAHQAVKDAEAKTKVYPMRNGGDYEYAAKSARAAADLAEAKENLKRVRAGMSGTSGQLQKIRQELAEALSAEYAARPSDIDSGTMTLLQSGILKPDEYARLMADATERGNTTMTRLIAKAAADAAEKYDANDKRGMELRAVAVGADDDIVSGKLGLYDVLTTVFERTANNIYMYDSWDVLTHRAVENI